MRSRGRQFSFNDSLRSIGKRFGAWGPHAEFEPFGAPVFFLGFVPYGLRRDSRRSFVAPRCGLGLFTPVRRIEFMTAPTMTPASSAIDCDFHFLVTLAEMFGFEGPGAFLAAFALPSSGVDAGGAVKLFWDASRRVQ